MTAIELLHAVERVGGSLALNGNQIKYTVPRPAVWLVHPTQRAPGRADRSVERGTNASADATGRAFTKMGTENTSHRRCPHGDRWQHLQVRCSYAIAAAGSAGR